MPTTTDIRVNDLIINKMTQEQYDALQDKSPTELYVVEGDSNVIYAEQAVELPTASESNLGKLYQYIGTTTASYINGYFYKCISDGLDPATYSWQQVDVQPAPSGLPDQTGHNGEFLTTDGTDASWSDKPLVNNANKDTSIAIGGSVYESGISGQYTTLLGSGASAGGSSSVCIGRTAITSDKAIAIGTGTDAKENCITIGYGSKTGYNAIGGIQLNTSGSPVTNSDSNTFKVANANGNFELMSADGTIPKERLANVVTTPSTMPELTVAGWSNNTQTVTVTGVSATNTVFVSPAPASAADYAAAGIICTAQAADSLTFTCTTVPTNAITVNVVIF